MGYFQKQVENELFRRGIDISSWPLIHKHEFENRIATAWISKMSVEETVISELRREFSNAEDSSAS